MQISKQLKRGLAASLLLLLCALATASPAEAAKAAAKTPTTSSAAKSPTDLSNAVTQSYNADPSVQVGMVVELKAKDPTTVIPLPNTDIKGLLGVVVPSDHASIVLTPEKVTQQQVLVTNSGHYSLLVSTQNGPIKTGDYIAVSAIAGIGMKADTDQEQVIGKAAGNFSGSANVISSVKLKDTLGHESTVAIGRVPLDIALSHNPLAHKAVDYVPSFLGKAASTVADKPVSAARIYLGLILLFITAIVTGVLLYGGVRSGMVAVGRNPLSKKSIMRSLIQTVIAGLIIFIAGVLAVYLLLKL